MIFNLHIPYFNSIFIYCLLIFSSEMLSELLLKKERKAKDKTGNKHCNGVIKFSRRMAWSIITLTVLSQRSEWIERTSFTSDWEYRVHLQRNARLQNSKFRRTNGIWKIIATNRISDNRFYCTITANLLIQVRANEIKYTWVALYKVDNFLARLI